MPPAQPDKPAKLKASMACSLENVEAFLEKQADIKVDCEDLLKLHLKFNPDVEWSPKDGPGLNPKSGHETAQLKLVSTHQFEETGKPQFPPPNTRLSDELVYLAIKHMSNYLRAQRYPYDFNKKGDVDPDRVPSGPAPIIWAHGLPFFPIYRGYYILCGRDHAACIGWLIEEMTPEVMRRSPLISIGAVIAPESAVRSAHFIDRQLRMHQPCGGEKDLRFKGKPSARDVVSSDHHECAILPHLDGPPQVLPLWRIPGYNAHCGPTARRSGHPSLVRKEFFDNLGLEDEIDYVYLCREYSNIYDDDTDDQSDTTDLGETLVTDDDMEDQAETTDLGETRIANDGMDDQADTTDLGETKPAADNMNDKADTANLGETRVADDGVEDHADTTDLREIQVANDGMDDQTDTMDLGEAKLAADDMDYQAVTMDLRETQIAADANQS